MDDIEHELAKLGIELGKISKKLRVREAEILVHDEKLAGDVSELIPRLEGLGSELKLLASRWSSIT
jgi:hypothetical protein